MLILKGTVMLLGAAFTLFGYLIFFRKKYFLINGYEKEREAGRRDEKYARRVGLTEWIAGITLMTAGIVLILFT